MKLLDAYRRLHTAEADMLDTADAAALLQTTPAHASKMLARLAETELILRLKRGLWAFPDRLDPLQIPGGLIHPAPCYISLQSALFYHGMISQIPSVIYAVSPVRTRRCSTPAGTVSIHRLDPAFFFGFEPSGKKGVPMATPEKALLDVLYLSPGKTRLFQHLPEIEIPESFDSKKALEMTRRIPSRLRQTIVRERLEKILRTTQP